jgi:hypothetical protein
LRSIFNKIFIIISEFRNKNTTLSNAKIQKKHRTHAEGTKLIGLKLNKNIHTVSLFFYGAICSIPVKAQDLAPVKVEVRMVLELSGDAPT